MKQVCLIILSFFATASSFSQIEYGIKGGLNLATVRYLNDDNTKARLGFNTGFFAEVPLQENLFVRPELLYSSKGYAYSAAQYSREGVLKLNYVAILLLAGFRPNSKVALMAGPEIGFLQKSISKSQGITTDMTSFYRHFDVGFDIGIAYSVNKFFGFEGRYNYGFKDLVNLLVTDNFGNVVGQGKTGANSVLQVGFYYFLSK